MQGPYLDTTKTHLQRALGDENVLIVRFHDCDINISDYSAMCMKIAKRGILVGLRLYRHFGDYHIKLSIVSLRIFDFFS